MYFNPNAVDTKERKRLVLTGFRGVDAASPMYKVDNQRAAAMKNFISINGYNHKRPGWKQIGRIKDGDGNALPINGYFKFIIAHQEIRIVYAGNKFFMYKNGAYCNMSSSDTIANNIDDSKLQNRPAQMYIDDDRAYFFGMGDLLVLGVYDGELQFRRIYNDSKTYIPTSTTNIAPEENDYYADGTTVKFGVRQSLRDINVLQSIRKNELIGSDYWKNKSTAGEQYADTDLSSNLNAITKTYQLDGKHLDDSSFEILASHFNNGETTEYKLTKGDRITGTCTRNLLACDLANGIYGENAADLNGQTITFDTNVKLIKKIGTYDSTDERFNIIKAGTFAIYATATDSTNNVLNIYYKKDTNATAVKVATARRLNAYVNYGIVWESTAISTPTVALNAEGVTANALTFRDDTSGNSGLNITCSGMYKRQYAIIDAKTASDGATPTITEFVPGGRRTWGSIDFDEGKIALVVHPHTISGEANIVVTFSQTDAEYAERITDCQFGTLFGAKGNANTLFVSGNTKYPNYDYWSNAEDFTYFPSGNLCCVGTSNTAIKGYQRLGDESLAIFKEDKGTEPTLYIRTGTATVIDTETSSVTEGYFITAGKFITQGPVASRSLGMLNGDAIFLSVNGVYGVQISSDSIAVEQRVARERSRLINPLLKKHTDLSQAVSIIHENKYYLALDNYVYVADARYVFNQKGDMTDTYNYEWWVWDNCPVKSWFVIDGELCFGTSDGRICRFDTAFTDRKYEEFTPTIGDTLNDGVIRVGYTASAIAGGLSSENLVYFKGTSIYRLLFAANDMTPNTDETSENFGKIAVSEANLKKLSTGMVVYADTITGGELSASTKYFVSNIDFVGLTFKLTDADGAFVEPGSSFRLLVDLNNEVLKVVAGSSGSTTYFTVKNRYTAEAYTIAQYNSETISATAYKHIEQNVVAEWVTPAFDMNANDYIKVMTRFSLATEQITDGAIVFGWETKNENGLKEVDSRGLDVFSFDNLDFDNFTFDTGFESAFTRCVKSSFNFIVFRFKSNNPYDCCVHSLTLEYKINRINKGVF